MATADDGLLPDEASEPEARQDLGLTRRSNPEARMPLMEHLRELRNRLVKAAAALTVGSVIGWVVYPWVWNFVKAPYCRAQVKTLAASAVHSAGSLGPHCQLYFSGVFDPLFLRLQISIAAGAIISSPVWLYQLWAFIAPGLYRRERRWAYFFVGAAIPLFAVGATIAYFAMTRGLQWLLHLHPKSRPAVDAVARCPVRRAGRGG